MRRKTGATEFKSLEENVSRGGTKKDTYLMHERVVREEGKNQNRDGWQVPRGKFWFARCNAVGDCRQGYGSPLSQ